MSRSRKTAATPTAAPAAPATPPQPAAADPRPAATHGAALPSPWASGRERVRERAVKREAVIRAAARAFNARGYHNTSLDDIAAALEVTKPTIYYYVTSKEQLLFQCFLTGLEQIRDAFSDAALVGLPARDRLTAVLRRYAQAIASDFGWCMVRAEDQDLSPVMSRHIKALKSEIDQGIRALIRAGIDDGSIPECDPKMTAFALAGALNWISHWFREDRSLSAAQIADAFVATFENGLRPRGRRRSARASDGDGDGDGDGGQDGGPVS